MEQDDLVEPIQEFGAEVSAHHVHHLRLYILDVLPVFHLCQELAAQVAGEDDQRVGEIDHPALPVGQAAIVEHLEQDVEDVGVRLLDLVEQHHLVGAAAHRLRQHPALVIADIARRRADQAGDRVLLHELAHVDANHRVVVIEQEPGERLGQFGLADACGAEEQEAA